VSATSASSVTVRRLTNRSIRTGNGIGVALAAVTALVDQLAASATASGRSLSGIGLCSPGLVDAERGRVALAVNLGWRDLPVRDRVRTELARRGIDVPLAFGHDVRAGGRRDGGVDEDRRGFVGRLGAELVREHPAEGLVLDDV
ncbi:ROK family protein, partial [Bacillus sp. S34]|nr:ROK family protein [Bacillus sp. S34]